MEHSPALLFATVRRPDGTVAAGRVWTQKPFGGNTERELEQATVILWKGFCSVHGRFRPEQVEQWRDTHPGIQVIVHPECRREVVSLADHVGSTETIIKTVTEAEPGTSCPRPSRACGAPLEMATWTT